MSEVLPVILESGAPPWVVALLAVVLWLYRDFMRRKEKREADERTETMKHSVGQLSKVLRETSYRLSLHRNGKSEPSDRNLPYLSVPPESTWEDTTETVLLSAERAERDAVHQIAKDSGREVPPDDGWPDWYASARDVSLRYSVKGKK